MTLALGACSSPTPPSTLILDVLPIGADVTAAFGEDFALQTEPRVWVVPTNFGVPRGDAPDTECQASLDAANASEQPAETGLVNYREPGDGQRGFEAEWKVGRYNGPDAAESAAGTAEALGDTYLICANEAKTDDTLTQMDFLDSSIPDTVGYALANEGRRVLVTSTGPYVLTVTAGKSLERAEQMLQMQLDRIAELAGE